MSAEQTKQLEQGLRPVAGRLRQAALRPRLVRAVFLGAAAAAVPALLRLFTGSLLWGIAGFVVLLGVPLITVGLALARKPDFRRAALAVDQHYRWQDRIVTAWSALAVGGLTTLEQFQAQDAAGRMTQVSPPAVVPLRIPAGIPKAALLAGVVLCALVWPIRYHTELARKLIAPAPETTVVTPIEMPPLPAVTPQLAAESLTQAKLVKTNPNSPDRLEVPAPNRRLIHDYFEAVCPPGR